MLEALAIMSLAAAPPPSIEARITARLRSFRGQMGLAACHLDTGETIAVAADERFPTASAIKTAVMVEAFHQMAAGRIQKDQLVTLTDEVKVGGYVIAIFARRTKDTRWSVDNDALVTGAEVSKMVFDHFTR